MLGLGLLLPVRNQGRGGASEPWHKNATIAFDFPNNLAYVSGVTTTPAAVTSTSRNFVVNLLNSSGIYEQIAVNTLPRTDLGFFPEPQRVNYLPRNRALDHVNWAKTDITAAKDRVGIDGVANSASTITATADNGTILYSITDSARDRWTSAFAYRVSGTGALSMTMDGGATWAEVIPADAPNSTAWARVEIPFSQNLANPVVGFKVEKNGAVFGIDAVQSENSATNASSPIYTAATLATRLANVTTFSTPALVALNVGTWYVEWIEKYGPINLQRNFVSNYVGSSTNERLLVSLGNKAQAFVVNTTTQVDLQSTTDVVAGETYRMAFAYTANDFANAYSPSLRATVATSASGSTPTGTVVLGLGQNGAGVSQANALMTEMFWFPVRQSDAQILDYAGGSAPEPPPIPPGTVYTPPAELTWPATQNGLAIPQSVTYTGTEFEITGDPDLTDYVNADIVTATPYYADAAMPDDTGNGLTPATAKQKIGSAVTLANGDMQDAGHIIVLAGDYPQAQSINGTTNIEPTKPMGFFASGGRVRHYASDGVAFTLDGVFTNCYSATTDTVRVFDRLNLDNKGLYTEIPMLATPTLVNGTATGGWVTDTGTTYIRRADGAAVTATNTLICSNISTATFSTAPEDIYFEGFDFEGGVAGAVALLANAADRNAVFDDCSASYAGSSASQRDGFRIETMNGLVLFNNCSASKNWKDGFSLHEGGGTSTVVLGLNPAGWYNGKSPAVSTNWLTTHELVRSWWAGGQGGGGYNGRDCAFVQDSITYMVGVWSTALATATALPCSFSVSDHAQLYLEDCIAESVSLSVLASSSGAPNATVYLRGLFTISGSESTTGGGVITTF